MDELNRLIDEFLDEVTKDERVKSLRSAYGTIKQNEDLSKDIKEFNFNRYNSVLKDKLMDNPLIINAHKCESECNYIILSINKELSIFKKSKGRCI